MLDKVQVGYDVVRATKITHLIDGVNMMIDDGWEAIGGVGGDRHWFHQAMVKYKGDDE